MNDAFVNPLTRGTPGIVGKTRTIKAWAREVLNLADEAVVSVNELSCHLPGCPPKETVILVMHQADTMQISIHKAMKDVAKDDIAYAFSASATGPV
ncbi:hypothetical protein [Sinorhizobium chiapasense]|uniref:Uncharacterized protein n=1 Tax=Sinorhizobium chiapasense TaxID=501572 RepID=A0ABZ2BIJ3_9HYPH